MKWFIMHLSLFVLGVLLFAIVLVYEIDGLLGFTLATLGVTLTGIGLTLKGIVKTFSNLFLP